MMKVCPVAVACLLVVLFLAVRIRAEVSDPLGGMLVPIKGGGAVNLLGNGGFVQGSSWRGTGDISQDGRFVIGSACWTENAFAGTHYLLLASGEWVGIRSNSVDELVLDFPLDPEWNISCRIVPFNTLASMFGEDNSAGFHGGTGIAGADILMPWDSGSQEYGGYYYFNTLRGRWEDHFNNPAGECIVFPDEALVVVAKTDREILLRGTVQLGALSGCLAGGGGTSIVPNPYPVDIPVSGSGLERWLRGAPTFAEADWVLDWDNSAQVYRNFYYYDNEDFVWRDLDNNPVGPGAVIPAGSAAVVIRNNPLPGQWILEQPFPVQ